MKVGNFTAALELWDYCLSEWPEDVFQAEVLAEKAECLKYLGDKASAVDNYRLVFAQQRRKPQVKTLAHVSFGSWIALTPHPELYDEALSILDEFADDTFANESFSVATARALIADAQGKRAEAADQAKLALELAALTHSGFARHPTVGLVGNVEIDLEARLKVLTEQIE